MLMGSSNPEFTLRLLSARSNMGFLHFPTLLNGIWFHAKYNTGSIQSIVTSGLGVVPVVRMAIVMWQGRNTHICKKSSRMYVLPPKT